MGLEGFGFALPVVENRVENESISKNWSRFRLFRRPGDGFDFPYFRSLYTGTGLGFGKSNPVLYIGERVFLGLTFQTPFSI